LSTGQDLSLGVSSNIELAQDKWLFTPMVGL